jgi:hypothetical protein
MDVPPPFKEANPDVSIPQDVEDVVMAALGKDIGDRPASMKELGEMLTKVLDSSTSTTVMTPQVGEGGRGTTPTPVNRVEQGQSSKSGMMIGIAVAVLVVLVGGGVGGWYFLAGSGANKKKPTASAVPPVTQPPATAAPPVAPPGPAQVASAAAPTPSPVAPLVDNSATKPLPATPETDDTSKDDGKGGGSKGIMGALKAKRSACVFKSTDDPVARAMKKMLKSQESKIKKCAPNNSIDKSVVTFKVAAGGNKATGLNSSGSDSFAGCVKKLVLGEFKTEEEVGIRRGNVVFGVTKQGGVIRACAVAVEAKARKSGLFTPPIIIGGTKATDKKKDTDGKKSTGTKKNKKKKSGKPKSVKIPPGIKLRKTK